MQSEAVIFLSPCEVVFDMVAIPDLGPGDALVEIEYSSISIGTERWCLLGQIQTGKDKLIEFPCVPGYQAAGIVREVGSAVNEVVPGDRVFSSRGALAQEGLLSVWGGHLQYHVAEASSLIKLPDEVSTREASGLVLAQVGYNGASRPRVEPGDTAVVIGDGLVGQFACQVLRHRGAHVILSGHHDERLALALAYGAADEVVNSAQQDLKEYVFARYPEGVPITVETASKRELIRLAVELLSYDAQFVLLGYYPEGECLIDTHWVRAKETTVYCPNAIRRGRMEATLSLIGAGHMHAEELITHDFPAAEAPAAYGLMLSRAEGFLGIVLAWTGN
jgi:2-desacetyl-2-hydroxyethyl bacteriochlorophyllide A dehydrogenase